jgi:hypothetical protein
MNEMNVIIEGQENNLLQTIILTIILADDEVIITA